MTQRLAAAGGWLGFDDFMALALYEPGLGYYARGDQQFGALPYIVQGGQRVAGSDFVTAPELSPLFGRALARQVAQALRATGTRQVFEFGAGSGALAAQLLQGLADQGLGDVGYGIVDVSGTLRQRQQATLADFAARVQWLDQLPAQMAGVVVGNEVLDAMPVKLLARVNGQWHERGVALGSSTWAWADRPTELRPPHAIEGEHDYLTEIHPQAQAFVRTLGAHLSAGAIFLLDYGFARAEYYHPQRHMGTLMCHRAHQADADPLSEVGDKDITAHIDFTGIALAGNAVGLDVLGYTSQARFLMNCGLLADLQSASLPQRIQAQKLIMEHEMGELFKVLAFCKGEGWDALGFASGDRTHTL
jgi:SAM-dependent MidA family methyltransferase